MELQQVKKDIKDLVVRLNQYNYEYYVLDNPTVDDVYYDSLMQQLLELEQKYPDLILESSPTQHVGAYLKTNLETIHHTHPMMSLGDIFSYDEVTAFVDKIQSVYKNATFDVELKMDGIASMMEYNDGLLVLSATRGDGLVGENITKNALTIASLPKILKLPVSLEIRGEVYMKKSVFTELNAYRKEHNEALFANPRNAAGGSLRQLDSGVTQMRKLDQYAYTLINPLNYGIKTQTGVLEYLLSLGFSVNPGPCP